MTEIRPDNDRFRTLYPLALALLTYLSVRATGGDADDMNGLAALLAAYTPLLPRP